MTVVRVAAGCILLGMALAGCDQEPSRTPIRTGEERAVRRSYDGAPPTIPHQDFGPHCVACHTTTGFEVPDVGFAPAMPHGDTLGLSPKSRCLQCHVFVQTDDIFRENGFVGLPQDLRRGDRLHGLAPPVMPHGTLMRENCRACHGGPAARPEIQCDHPDRPNCRQCHVPVLTSERFQGIGQAR